MHCNLGSQRSPHVSLEPGPAAPITAGTPAAYAVRGGGAMSDACISFLLEGILVLREQLKELEPVAPPTPLPDDLRKPQQPLLLARLHPISFLQLPIPSPRVCHLCVEHDDWASGSDVGD